MRKKGAKREGGRDRKRGRVKDRRRGKGNRRKKVTKGKEEEKGEGVARSRRGEGIPHITVCADSVPARQCAVSYYSFIRAAKPSSGQE